MPGDADASRVKDVKRWNDSKNQRHFFSNGWRCEKMYQESRARAYTWYNIIIDYILLLHCMVCLRHCVQTLFVLKVIRAALFCGNRIWNAWKSCIGRQWRGFAALFFGLSWSLIWILPIWLKPYDPQNYQTRTSEQRPLNRSTLGPLGCNLTRSSLRDFRTSPLNITQAQTRCHPSHLSHLKCQTLIWDTQTAHTARHFASEISQ